MPVSSTSKWTIRNIYLYLVCFVALMIIVFSVSNLVYNLIGIAYPAPVMRTPIVKTETATDKMTLEEQEKLQAYQAKYERDNQKYYAVRGSIRDGVLILLVVPLYIYHWRKIQAENEKETE